MYKLLMVEDRPIVINGLSLVVKDALKDVQLSVAKSFLEMETMLVESEYRMLILCLPIEDEKEMNSVLLLLEHHRSMVVLILADNTESLPMQKLYRSGISGVVGKQASTNEIKKAIQQVYNSNIYVDDNFVKDFFSPKSKEGNLFQKLTTKEKIVAKMLMEGSSNTKIGQILTLRPSTVSTFKLNIFKKLKVDNLIDLGKVGRTILNAY